MPLQIRFRPSARSLWEVQPQWIARIRNGFKLVRCRHMDDAVTKTMNLREIPPQWTASTQNAGEPTRCHQKYSAIRKTVPRKRAIGSPLPSAPSDFMVMDIMNQKKGKNRCYAAKTNNFASINTRQPREWRTFKRRLTGFFQAARWEEKYEVNACRKNGQRAHNGEKQREDCKNVEWQG